MAGRETSQAHGIAVFVFPLEEPMAKININGKLHDVQAEGDTPLLWVIREQVGLTGTKYGCGVAQCGACSVHINGEVRRSCSIRSCPPVAATGWA